MRRLLGLVVPLSVAFATAAVGGVAHAECSKAYTGQQLSGDLGAMSTALRGKDDAALKAAGMRLDAGLPCLDAPVPQLVFAAAYRSVGVYQYKFGSKDRASQWFRSGLELDSSFEWDIAEVDPGAPMRQEIGRAHV